MDATSIYQDEAISGCLAANAALEPGDHVAEHVPIMLSEMRDAHLTEASSRLRNEDG